MAAADGWHELAVANPTFLLERLGSECTDLQGLRELTVNGLDAIAALGADRPGRVVWDLDWERFDESGGRVRKLSVIDTGTGMTAEQLRHYINQLAASGREQSSRGNFGVGAKVAAGSRNPHGLEYRSWQEGHGSLVCFKRHPDGRWGLEPQRWADGRVDYWRPLGDAEKPWLLRGQDHGTQVVLLGQHERHDTTQAPQTVTDARRHWITRYLNGRFLRFPAHVEVLVREHHGRDEQTLRRIHGEQHHLEHHAVAAGTVELSDAIVRWWVLDDDHRSPAPRGALCGRRPVTPPPCSATSSTTCWRRPAAGTDACRTSAFASAASEWFCTSSPRTRSPVSSATPRERCCCSTTSHCRGHAGARSSPPQCPSEILRLQELAAGTDCVPRREAIRGRVSAILPLYRLSRYRPTRTQSQRQAEPATARPDDETTVSAAERSGSPSTEPAVHPTGTSVQREPNHSLAGDQAPADDPDQDALSTRDRRSARRRVDLSARRNPGAGRPRRPGRPLPPRSPRADHQRRLPRDHRPDRTLARPLPRRPRRPRDDRGAGPGMVRTGPGRGGARRPQLAVERGAARRASIAELVHRRPAATAPAARNASEATRAEARDCA